MAIKVFKTISEFYEFRKLPAPEHPLISVLDVSNVKFLENDENISFVSEFYSIAVKHSSNLQIN